ncbi:MAG: hypothetical protein ABR592_07985 [Nitriliruptorales bacterium]
MFDWRSALLRRLARRFHIGEDVVRHLSTFQRLGERFEIQPPSEMLPVGARTLLRALRTRGAAQIRPEWVWPFWLERQLDPTSVDFVPRGHLPFAANVTHRNWTAVGNLDSAWEAIVDPSGLVTPMPDSWSVDWWIREADRWHLPSRASDLRQTLVDSTPMLETTLRLDNGAAVHRVYAVELGTGEFVIVEVLNRCSVPLEVAFALRPYNPEGLAVVQEVEVTGDVVIADEQEALVLLAPPLGGVASTYHLGDAFHALLAGHVRQPPLKVNDPSGLAHAAVVYAVEAGGVVKVGLPLPPRSGLRAMDSERGRVRVSRPEPHELPEAVDVVSRWARKLDQGLGVRLPDDRLQQAVDANRCYLLLLHDPGDITAGPSTYHRFWFRDAAYQLVALDRWGFHAEAADVLASYPDRQHADGFFYSQWREWDANGAALWAIAEHHRLTEDNELIDRLLPSLRQAVNWIERIRSRGWGGSPELEGLLPAGVSAEHLGPFDYYYWDDFWSLRGLLDGAYLARARGEQRSAARIEAAAERFRQNILDSIATTRSRTNATVIPAGPHRGIDAGMIGSLAACSPLGLLAADDPWIVGTLELIRERFCVGDAFYQSISHTGLGTYLTLQLAAVELEAGDLRSWRRLAWLLGAATSTFTWPEAIHPQLGGGCMGDGHHGWAAADFLNFVRNVLVSDTRDGVTAALSLLPPEWMGREVEVREAPTHAGRLSYRLSWDGVRPVLTWEWTSGGGVLTAPGLDPSWSSTDPAGEAVLARVATPH